MRSYVIANWKLNGSKALIDEMIATLGSQQYAASVVICPPAVYLNTLQQSLEKAHAASIKVGAQNCSEHTDGAYTGELSAAMLGEQGADYIIVGHSERRTLYGETDAVIAAKVTQVQQAGLTAVLCVGETLAQREGEETVAVVARQLAAVLDTTIDFGRLIIAYEPVWAIGTGRTATPEQAQAVHQQIRAVLREYDAEWAEKVPLLYGGSVKADNAAVLFAQADINGGLIGGASLQPDQFGAICAAVKG